MSYDDIHVYPENDLQEHTLQGFGCPCQPTVKMTEGATLLIVHNAFDHREIIEQAIAILNGEDEGDIPEDPHESPALH